LRNKLPDGYKSVSTKSLVPAALDGIGSGDEFIKKLPEYDQEFDKLRSDAFKENKVLRFVGVIDVASGVIKADLERWVFELVLISRLVLMCRTGTLLRTPLPPHSVDPTTSSCSIRSDTAHAH